MQPIAVAAKQQYASLAAEIVGQNIQSPGVPIPVAGSAAAGAPGRYVLQQMILLTPYLMRPVTHGRLQAIGLKVDRVAVDLEFHTNNVEQEDGFTYAAHDAPAAIDFEE